MSGIEFDSERAAQCSSRLRQIQEHAARIAELAQDADPEPTTWGLLGLQLFFPAYTVLATGVHRHLAMVEEGLGKGATAIDACAENYRAQDEAIANALTGIESCMGAKH